MDPLAIKPEHDPRFCAGQSGPTLGDDVEHRLYVRGRFANDLQNFGRGRLPLQRFLGLVEQPHVFDGDYGLVHERFRQRDFLVAVRTGLVARQRQHADALVLAQQRQHERRGYAGHFTHALFVHGYVDCRPVRDVQHGLADNHARREGRGRIDGHDALAQTHRDAARRRRGDGAESRTVATEQRGEIAG